MDLTLKATREAFGDAVLNIASKDKNVVALTADLGDSLKLTTFSEVLPEQFFDLGVAEQNMMGVAAGLALDGRIPFVASFAVFSPGRNWDQLRISVCYNNANVKIIGGYVGFSNGKDGATHQALEDIALTRVLPNLVVLDTADYDQTISAVRAMYKYAGPVYLRIRRDPIISVAGIISQMKKDFPEESKDFVDYDKNFSVGGSQIIREGKDVTIIACGAMVQKAIEASVELAKEKISSRIINLYSIKPIDRKTVLESAKLTGVIVTIEEHQYAGGIGSAVAETVLMDNPVPMKIIGVDNQFGETGSQDQLLESKKLTVENIVWNVKKVLKMKGK